MRKSTLIGGLAGLAASMILVLPPPVAAQGAPADNTGSIYADLVVALRDLNGVPIPAVFPVLQEDPLPPLDQECVQPISYAPLPLITTTTYNPVDERDVYLIPLMGETLGDGEVADPAVISVCDVQPNYAMYVSEAALERLNLARTKEDVLESKLAETEIRLITADEIALDGAGRITTDGVAIDASPDHAAIYWSLMRTGQIPGLVSSPAEVVVPGGTFDAWYLAAAAIGTAASKSVPITIDTVEYYNRIQGAVDFPGDPDANPDPLPPFETWAPELDDTVDGEQFVDYRGFSYTRSEVFRGCTTWLDATTMTWLSGDILDVVPFTDVVDGASSRTLTNVAGFTQLADDVRSVIDFMHYYSVIPGFQIDTVFDRTCEQQVSWATMWGGIPDDVFQTDTVPISTSVFMPWIGTPVPRAQLQMTIDADAEFTATNQVVLDGEGEYTTTLPSMIESMVPKRVADTRVGFSTADGQSAGIGVLQAGKVIQIPIAGRVGIPADAAAAVVNVTAVGPAAPGFLTVYPCGSWSGTSSLNYVAGEVVANEVIAKLSPTGSICVYTMAATNLVVDAVGYVPAGSDYTSLVPKRMTDTRVGFSTADGIAAGTGVLPAGTYREIPIAGRVGIPADAAAAVVNVTAVGPAAPGFLTVYPCGIPPATSSLNYVAGQVVANEVIAKLSATGSICVYTMAATNLVVDAVGYVPAGTDYTSLVPKRMTDTRVGFSTADGQSAGIGLLPAGQYLEIPIAGRVGIPADASAVVVNVTAVGSAAPGFLTVYPCGTRPGTSSLNYTAGEVVANEVIAKLSATGSICVYTMATTNLVVDAVGYLVPNTETVPAAGAVEFALTEEGDLVGMWPEGSFEVGEGDNLTTMFDLTVAAGAPVGEYTTTLELVDLDGVAVTATDIARTNVIGPVPTALWSSTAEYVPLGSYFPMTARVFNPATELAGASLRVTVAPPSDVAGLAATAFSEAVPMTLPLDVSSGNLVGVWPLDDPLVADTDELITWYLNVADTSPTGIYTITVELMQGATSLSSDSADVIIVAAAEHGKKPPGVGD